MGEDVLRELIDAVRRGDGRRMRTLCADHDGLIKSSFPSWRRVPEDVRTDPTRTQWYARTLLAVAQAYEQSGDAALLRVLLGPSDEGPNPLPRWQQAIDAGRAAVTEGRWAEAERLLASTLREVAGYTSPDAESLRALTEATLGQALFHLGRAHDAIDPLASALDTCERHADHDGVVAHSNSLIEVHRWLGRPQEAALVAERAADILDRAGQLGRAGAMRKRAASARRPEPLVRVVLETERGIFEEHEIDPAIARGKVRFFYLRNRPEVGETTRLVEEGTRLGASGDHAGALAAFDAAAAVDPHDPRPPHLAGLALMHLARYDDARARYDRTEVLAPGWYQCRTDRWIAGQLAAGKVDHGVLETLVLADDPAREPKEILTAVRSALKRHPIAPLFLLEAKARADLGQDAEAERAARAGLACAEEADVRTRLLVRLATLAQYPERGYLLEEATALEGNLVAAAMARVMLTSA